MKKDYDILIVGAGIVGTSLALALSHLPLRIALMEQKPFINSDGSSLLDKPIALNYASLCIFQTLGLNTYLANCIQPIEEVLVSQEGCFGSLRITAKEMGVSRLGGVIPAHQLTEILINALCRLVAEAIPGKASFDLFSPVQCEALTKVASGWQVLFRTQQRKEQAIYPRLIIAADGGNSTVRHLLNIGIKIKSDKEAALVTTLYGAKEHHGTAYQLLMDEGVIACLPLLENKLGLVWVARREVIDEITTLVKADFLASLPRYLTYRLGEILHNDHPHVYFLKSFIAEEQAQPGLILLGNAAHALSPIAAQGLNLGLQDMAELVDIIGKTVAVKKDLSDPSLIQSYLQARLSVQERVMGFTERLSSLTQSRSGLWAFVCSKGLFALDCLPPFKRSVSQRLMGIHGRLPRLVRGLIARREEYEHVTI